MGKVKIKRKSTLIDMTAMSDVTVLLLTFFMLTSTFLQKEPTIVYTPSSVSEEKVPVNNLVTVLISSADKSGKLEDPSAVEGKLFISFTGDADSTFSSEKIRQMMLKEALILPKKEGRLDVTYKNVMSVTVPCFSLDMLGTGGADSYNYGMAFTSGELDASLAALNGILEDLVRLAELEKTAQMLAEEIERTRRRVNALEYVMIPEMEKNIKYISMKLDENERSSTIRLMKVKDIILKEAIEERRETDKAEGADV